MRKFPTRGIDRGADGANGASVLEAYDIESKREQVKSLRGHEQTGDPYNRTSSLQDETTKAHLPHTTLHGRHQGNYTTPFEDAHKTRKVNVVPDNHQKPCTMNADVLKTFLATQASMLPSSKANTHKQHNSPLHGTHESSKPQNAA